jgi:hypothetical protein
MFPLAGFVEKSSKCQPIGDKAELHSIYLQKHDNFRKFFLEILQAVKSKLEKTYFVGKNRMICYVCEK